MSPVKFVALVTCLVISGIAFSQAGYYPPPSSVNYQNDTLTIYPPDSLPGDPVMLVSYNIYIDNEFFDNAQMPNSEEVVQYFLDDEDLLPGTRIFCVTAVYNEWISESTCDTAVIIYGYELPFYEDWSSGSFETQQWSATSDRWIIQSEEGNPAPSAVFQGVPGLSDYEVILESYPINAMGINEGWIDLDLEIKLDVVQSTGEEHLVVQAWNNIDQIWRTVHDFTNEDGSFEWEKRTFYMHFYQNKIFKIRFLAGGSNSNDIVSWQLDNIHIYRYCHPTKDLELNENNQYNYLEWYAGDWGLGLNEWIYWDDGENSGNSIGTGAEVEFDVAARWIPGQLDGYDGQLLDYFAFFPAESQATYRVRVWTGTGPDTLVIDQPVDYPLIGMWNYVSLDNPIVLDASRDLWLGYHISTPSGYPAGVDDGPAVDGYGNMIFWDSTWTTLLEISEDLNYNWNISGHFNLNPFGDNLYFNVYRETNLGGYELYARAYQASYRDSSILLSDYYCYQVTVVYAEEGDTCESPPTNYACETVMLGSEQFEDEFDIRIYPNPASSILNVESPEEISEIRIFDLMGKCVLKMEIGNSEFGVDVRSFKKGLYFIEVRMDNRRYGEKVVVM